MKCSVKTPRAVAGPRSPVSRDVANTEHGITWNKNTPLTPGKAKYEKIIKALSRFRKRHKNHRCGSGKCPSLILIYAPASPVKFHTPHLVAASPT